MADTINSTGSEFVFSDWLELFQKYRDDMEKELETVRLHKKEVQNIPFLKQVFAIMRAKAIDRENVRQGMQVILDVFKLLKIYIMQQHHIQEV